VVSNPTPGSCCLLLGANGAGKTTLLKILGGKHMVPKGKVLIHGREAGLVQVESSLPIA
jgi:ABC-type uncharacterized transport system ATPase subunit